MPSKNLNFVLNPIMRKSQKNPKTPKNQTPKYHRPTKIPQMKRNSYTSTFPFALLSLTEHSPIFLYKGQYSYHSF